jgi:hypothetical protein
MAFTRRTNSSLYYEVICWFDWFKYYFEKYYNNNSVKMYIWLNENEPTILEHKFYLFKMLERYYSKELDSLEKLVILL